MIMLRIRFLLVLALLLTASVAGTAFTSADASNDARMCPTAVEYAVIL